MDDIAEVKHGLAAQFARVAKALGHPRRIELVELLAQGERGVDALVSETGLPLTTVSSQLLVLKGAGLVGTRRDGTRVIYRLADDEVASLLASIQAASRACLPEVELIERTYFAVSAPERETVTREELRRRASEGTAIVLDVRPHVEYDSGHIPGALSIPLPELERRLGELPHDVEIVAYCRGPFCVLAEQAVRLLRQEGFEASRLDSGLPEWRLAGMPVVEDIPMEV